MIELIGGILMAFANSVPGVSGGTIAFLMGFFDDMVSSLNTFLSKDSKENRTKSLFFLIRLGIGWIVGFVAAVLIVTSVFETHIYAVSSLFIGFILFSIPLVVFEEKKTLKGRYYNALWIIPGAAVVVGITALSSFTAQTEGFFRILLAVPAAVFAICAMILPGISGSSLLMIFGLYEPVMAALKGFLHLDFSGLPLIIAFGVGAVIGAVGNGSRHGHQIHQIPVPRHRQHEGVSVSLRKQIAHDPADKALPCAQRIGVDVHEAGKLVLYPDISLVGDFPQLDGGVADDVRHRVHAVGHVRAVDQPGIATHGEAAEIINARQPRAQRRIGGGHAAGPAGRSHAPDCHFAQFVSPSLSDSNQPAPRLLASRSSR